MFVDGRLFHPFNFNSHTHKNGMQRNGIASLFFSVRLSRTNISNSHFHFDTPEKKRVRSEKSGEKTVDKLPHNVAMAVDGGILV